jgi:hypothetical protein
MTRPREKLGGPNTEVSSRPSREVRRVTATTAAGRQRLTYPRIWATVGLLAWLEGCHKALMDLAMVCASRPP